MALSEGGGGDLDEPAVLLQFVDGMRAAVAHAGTDAANQLEHGVLYRSLIGDAAFHAFRHQLLGVGLEVAVLAAVFHGGDGAHAAVYLVLSSLVQFEGSGALVAACEDASHHADVSAGGDGLGHVSGILDAAVRDDRDAVFLRYLIGLHDRRYLRHADTGDYAGGADGAGADAHLYRIRSRFDQGLRALAGGDVSGDDLQIREFFLDHAQAAQHVLGMSMGGIQDDHVHLGVHQGAHAVEHVRGDSHARAAQQASLGVFCGKGIFDGLLNVLDGDQAHQVEILIYNRKLFLPCLREDLLRFLQGDAFPCGDQALGGHGFLDLLREVCFKFEIPVGDDADQLTAFRDRYAGNAELRHQVVRILKGMLGRKGKWIGNDSVF